MGYKEFRCLLNLFMVSDPWPLSPTDRELMESMLDRISQERGYEHWLDAYHKY
jgi:hypothetical protein